MAKKTTKKSSSETNQTMNGKQSDSDTAERDVTLAKEEDQGKVLDFASDKSLISKETVVEKKESKTKKLKNFLKKITIEKFITLNDKLAFTMGVIFLIATTFILGRSPNYLPIWYLCWSAILLPYRFWYFRSLGWHYFLLDFCYLANAATLFYLFLYPTSPHLFLLTFANNSGPVLFAIVFWRNSLVLHDPDKLVSCYIHSLPPLLSYVIRWYPEYFNSRDYSTCLNNDCTLPFYYFIFIHMAFFLFWECAYFLKTEMLDKPVLDERDHLLTSFRWIAIKDTKSGSYRFINKFSEPYRVFVFIGLQALYHFLTVLPVKLMYDYFWIHTAILIYNFIVMIYNGGSFYFEKFIDTIIEQSEQGLIKRKKKTQPQQQ
ncbi:hypothetical protein ABK040_005388 [Willaertia magna]